MEHKSIVFSLFLSGLDVPENLKIFSNVMYRT